MQEEAIEWLRRGWHQLELKHGMQLNKPLFTPAQALKKEAADNKKKKERMETLCRTLTQERADLKDKLRALVPSSNLI
jgi:hypothetical protein